MYPALLPRREAAVTGGRARQGIGPPEIGASLRVALPAAESFAVLREELRERLALAGLTLPEGSSGPIRDARGVAGRLESRPAARRLTIRWRSRSEGGLAGPTLELHVDPARGGALVKLRVRPGTLRPFDEAEPFLGWAVASLLAPAVVGGAPIPRVDYLLDRMARRPSGRLATETYRDPRYHWPNFLLLLGRLRPTRADLLLEVGCGGGAFLHRALESGCRAVGVDHSPAMVRLARRVNRAALRSGRLEVLRGEADHLPVDSGRFTAAVMTGVLNLLDDPVAVLREIHRALRPGGRMLVYGGTAALRGTPAAPEPIAAHLHWYTLPEVRALARRAGFRRCSVESPAMIGYARAAGVPAEGLPLFEGIGGSILLSATKGAR